MTKIKKLKPREIPKGTPSRVISIDFPKDIEEQIKMLSDQYGSIRNVFEVACREFIYQNEPVETDRRWTYSLRLAGDIADGLNKRIPFYGLNLSQLVRFCVIRFLERRKK